MLGVSLKPTLDCVDPVSCPCPGLADAGGGGAVGGALGAARWIVIIPGWPCSLLWVATECNGESMDWCDCDTVGLL